MSTSSTAQVRQPKTPSFYEPSPLLSTQNIPRTALIVECILVRIRIAEAAASDIEKRNAHKIRTSSFFKEGYQQNDARFQFIFYQVWGHARGNDGLINHASRKIVKRLRLCPYNYPDVYYQKVSVLGGGVDYDDREVVSRYPTETFKNELKKILEKNLGFQWHLFMMLRKEFREIPGDIKLTDCEWDCYGKYKKNYGDNPKDYMHCALSWLTIGSIGFASKTFGDKLKKIYCRLLVSEWFKEDQKRLLEYLGRNPRIQRQVTVPLKAFNLEKQGRYFKTYCRHVVVPTLGDGACALHALLGENVNGVYCYKTELPAPRNEGDVRSYFIKTLTTTTQRTYNPNLQKALVETLQSHLDAALKGDNISSNMLFRESEEGLKILEQWAGLKNHYTQKVETFSFQEALRWLPHLNNPRFVDRVMAEVRAQKEGSRFYVVRWEWENTLAFRRTL